MNSIFEQMAAQGQTMFCASGDSGAYANGQTLSLIDTASQPFVCSVGGTTLSTNGQGGSWKSEMAWSGSGGGVSTLWPIPSWQAQPDVAGTAYYSSDNSNADNYRNVPDVALNADNSAPYSIYFAGSGGWTTFSGTSAAAPLWAAFTALVNQQRTANGRGPIGFINPYLYAIGTAQYLYDSDPYYYPTPVNDFHDITQGNNLSDYAEIGYDDATGWGSFNGTVLLNDLTHEAAPPTVPLPLYSFSNYNYNDVYEGTIDLCDSMNEAAQDLDYGYDNYGNGVQPYDGVSGLVYNSPYDAAGLVPLYKFSPTTGNGNTFFSTSSSAPPPFIYNDGVVGYVYPPLDDTQTGTIPLDLYYNASTGWYGATTNTWLPYNNSSWTYEGTICYIIAP